MSTIGASAFTLPAYNEATLKDITKYQARAARLLDFLRQKAEREPAWAAHHDNGKWGHCFQLNNPAPDDNICATPVCALGWAVDQGICGDVMMHVTARWDDRGQLGIGWDESQKRMLKVRSSFGGVPVATRISLDGLSARDIKHYLNNRYKRPKYSFGSGDLDVEPVLDGYVYSWPRVGLKYFGSVVTMSVFFAGEASLSQVIERLQEYVDHARITIDTRFDDEPPGEWGEDGETVYFHNPDTLMRQGQLFLRAEHGKVAQEFEAHDGSLFLGGSQ